MNVTELGYKMASNGTQNSTSSNEQEQRYVIGIITAFVCAIGFVASSFCLCFIATHFRKLQSSTTFLFVNLSVSSFVFSTIALPVVSYTLIAAENSSFAHGKNQEFCRISGWLYMWTITLCAYSHAAIAMNRLFVVVLARFFSFLLSHLVTVTLNFFACAISLMVSILPYVKVGGEYGWLKTQHKCFLLFTVPWYSLFYRIIYSFLPLTVMLVCYAIILCWLVNAKRKPRAVGNSGGHRPRRSRFLEKQFLKERKATWVALATCLIFIIFFLPVAVFGVAAGSSSGATTRTFFGLWIQIGCAINPVAYMLLSSRLRITLYRCFRCWFKTTGATATAEPKAPPSLAESKL